MIKNAYAETIGRTVGRVIIKRGDHPPYRQMFLLFTDGTCLELWGSDLSCSATLDPFDADQVRSYLAPDMRVVAESSRRGEIIVPGQE